MESTSFQKTEFEMDPNTLWPSPYDNTSQQAVFNEKRVEAASEVDSILNADPSDIIKGIRVNMAEFSGGYKIQFQAFWSKMNPNSREYFIRSVYPTIVQSAADKYSLAAGRKVYHHRHDRYLELEPRMTIEYLISGNNMVDLVEELSHPDGLMWNQTSKVCELRKRLLAGTFTLTKHEVEQFEKEKVVAKGSMLVFSAPNDFGKYMQVNNPDNILKSKLGEVNLYEKGNICKLAEYNIVVEVIHFMYCVVGSFIDEFRVQVLRHKKSDIKLCGPQSLCAGCKAVKKDLKRCSACNVTSYCSR